MTDRAPDDHVPDHKPAPRPKLARKRVLEQKWEPPAFVTVPTPMQMTRARGAASTSSYGTSLRVRCTNVDERLVQQEADALGVTESNFMRWAGVHLARVLHKLRTGKDVDIDT